MGRIPSWAGGGGLTMSASTVAMREQQMSAAYATTRLQSLSMLDVDSPPALNRMSSIIATIGPACRDVPTLELMMAAGLDIARLNFSHGSHDYHRATIANVREAAVNVGRQVLRVHRTHTHTRTETIAESKKKQDTKLLPITLLNIGRFSKFFHC